MYTEPRKPWIHRMLLWILGLLPERRTNLVLWDCGMFCMDVKINLDPDFRYDYGDRSKGLGNRWYRYSVRDKHFARRMYVKHALEAKRQANIHAAEMKKQTNLSWRQMAIMMKGYGANVD